MITYVNTVFVSNNANAGTLLEAVPTAANAASAKGKFILYDVDNGAYTITANTTRFKIGMVNGKVIKDHKGQSHADIKWSNIINVADVKSISTLEYMASTEDSIEIDFTNMEQNVAGLLAQGGKRVIVRLTFKDMPHRYRKWTESYEYVTEFGDNAAAIALNLATLINKQWKRARVEADGTTTAGKLVLTALPYDDDNAVETLNWAEKVRFNANIYFTDPAADGWESLNKHFPTGVTINKTPGYRYAADAKLVRDRESQALGYDGILNRGDGTWPIIKPALETDLNAEYNAITLEFENMYRAADDIFRKTKQCVEIYMTADTTALAGKLTTAITLAKDGRLVTDTTTEDPTNDQ